MTLLPGLALVTVYFVALRPTYDEQIVTVRKQVADEERLLQRQHAASSAVDFATEITAAEQRRADLAAARVALQQRWSKAATRAETVRTLSRLLDTSGVLVERSTAETAEGQDSRVPLGARLLAQRLAADGGDAPTIWRLDLRCGWQDLTASLDRLAEVSTFTLPIGIQIAPGKGTNTFEVSLWLWI